MVKAIFRFLMFCLYFKYTFCICHVLNVCTICMLLYFIFLTGPHLKTALAESVTLYKYILNK